MTIAAIPSPSTAVWHLGPVPLRAYALCIVLGIVVACVVTEARLRKRGAPRYAVLDVAVWAVPFGIVGARIYHVITSPADYFGADGEPLRALMIWEGGLGIWGAVAGGAVGAWLGCRQLGIPLTVFADALAPGLPLAQAVGRIGNWFNNELYGGPTTLPWGLEVHRMDPDNPGRALTTPDGQPELRAGLFHPTFAYEALWNVGVAVLVLMLDRRLRFGRGRAFALYVMGYTVGRFWIELMRTDPANEIFGQRVNVWVSVLVFLGALAYFLRVRGPREFLVPVNPSGDGPSAGGYRVVGEDAYRTYQRTGEVPAEGAGAAEGAVPAEATVPGGPGRSDDDADDGADLVDVTMPALDDFADDEPDLDEESVGSDDAEDAEDGDDDTGRAGTHRAAPGGGAVSAEQGGARGQATSEDR